MKSTGRTSLLRRVGRCDLGATAVEFALVAWIFILFILGIVEVGRALDVRNQISRSVDAGARSLLVPKSANLLGDAENAAKAALTTADPDELVVALETETVDGLSYRKLRVSYPFKPMLAGIISPLTLSVERIVCPETECKAP